VDPLDPPVLTRQPDDISFADQSPGAHVEPRQVGVGGADIPSVIDRDRQAPRHRTGEGHPARGNNLHRAPRGTCQIHPPVPFEVSNGRKGPYHRSGKGRLGRRAQGIEQDGRDDKDWQHRRSVRQKIPPPLERKQGVGPKPKPAAARTSGPERPGVAHRGETAWL
jgi:hypothetical protein